MAEAGAATPSSWPCPAASGVRCRWAGASARRV